MIRCYLLDTGIAQDYQADRNGIRQRFALEKSLGHRVGICVPVLGELWAGVEGSMHQQHNRSRLLHALSRLVIWPYTVDAARHYGRIFADLRRRGRPMQHVDIQVAAIANSLNNCVPVTKDSDFAAIPGLAI